jgi:hypothetical protein
MLSSTRGKSDRRVNMKRVFLLLFRTSTFFCFLSLLLPSYPTKAAHEPWLDLGEEDPKLLVGAIVTTFVAIGSGAIACSKTKDSCECGWKEIGGKFGIIFPGRAFGAGPTLGADMYFRVVRNFKMGFGYSFSELQNAPVFEYTELKYSPETGESYLQVNKYELETDTYVGSYYLTMKIASGRGRNCYVGSGIGFFFASSDHSKDITQGLGVPLSGVRDYTSFGNGTSYQFFAGIMSKRTAGKARFSAEIRLSIMKSSDKSPDSVFEEAFRGTDFGGLSITGGMVF